MAQRKRKNQHAWLEDSDDSDVEDVRRDLERRAIGAGRSVRDQGGHGGSMARAVGPRTAGGGGDGQRRNRDVRVRRGVRGSRSSGSGDARAAAEEPRLQNSEQEAVEGVNQDKQLRSCAVFLTYSQVDFHGHSKELLIQHLKLVTDRMKVKIEELVVAHEKHADGGSHYHAWVKFNRRARHQPLYWKWEGRTACVRTNIKSAQAVIKYCRKDGDFLQAGIDMTRYTDCVKNHKRYIAQRVIDAGEITTDLIDEHPEILYDIGRINEGLDYYNIRKVAERSREEYKPAWTYFYNWQAGVLDYLSRPPTRAPYWMVDDKGLHGKSQFATFLEHRRGAILLTICDPVNVVFIVKTNIRKWLMKRDACIIFDFPRDYNFDHCYALVEALCNGFIASTKYCPTALRFPPPHIVIFSNVLPRDKNDEMINAIDTPYQKAWSDDRWENFHIMDVATDLQNSAITSDLWEGEPREERLQAAMEDNDKTIDLDDPKWSAYPEPLEEEEIEEEQPLPPAASRVPRGGLIDLEAMCSDDDAEEDEGSFGSLEDFIVEEVE
jgi:hypothetical protein